MNHPISHPRRLVHLLTFLALVLSGWAGLALAAQDPPEEITPEEEQEEFDVFALDI